MKTAILNSIAAGALACLLASSCAQTECASQPEAQKADAQAPVQAEDSKPEIDASAAAQLKSMCDLLSNAKSFSVKAEIWHDMQLPSGQRVQIGKTLALQVKRPNRFHIEMKSPRRHGEFFYDGHSITLYNKEKNFYGSFEAPAAMDDALDLAEDRFGVELPLADIIVSDPYQNAVEKATRGIDLIAVPVLGVPCEHLSFTDGKIDWQLWIEQGPRPTLKKAVITYSDEEKAPQYTVIFSDWNFNPEFPDSLFVFAPPEGAVKIDVAELKKSKAERPAAKEAKP